MRSIKLCVSIIAVIFLSQVFAVASYPESSPGEPRTITAISVEKNKSVSTETILSKIKTKVGDKMDQAALNEDLKRLYATEYFTDVSIDVQDHEGGVAVTFIVEEKPIIDDIIFDGNMAIRSPKLKSSIKSKPNEMLNLAVLAQDIADIKTQYVKKGYPLVEVTYKIDMDKETNKARITIKVDEKARITVSKIDISGNKAIASNNIRKILGTKTSWFFMQGVFSEDILQDDLEKIKALYDDIGYLDAEVSPKMNYRENGTLLDITFDVNEGKQYLVGDIAVKGNLVLPEKDVRSKIMLKSGKPFSTRTLRNDLIMVRQYYYQFGYMNAIIDVERNLNQETGRIDVTFNIDAKDPVYVGKVEVRGNIKTRDVVIRRELRIYPGEKFDGEKIRRSKERLYNLGFFENVNFDTEPTSAPDIQNLVVNVKESKTGEFGFGGGYSSIDMLIGFVEVTQRNFDIMNFPTFTGGGQNLVLKAEFGMVRTNYNVGWTDPWIFGLPFSGGFDFYRTSHTRDEDVGWAYDETRTGADLKFGKEITDYLRVDLTYRLEQVEIENVISNASQDLRSEEGKNTISSLMFETAMDTRDNIYNPTKGYVIGGSIEDAGGVFCGTKDFIKATVNAAYYHTFFEKFVLEVKGRAGWADSYDDTTDVPIYERFYAGGENTIRGYRERRVGPRDVASGEPIGGEAIVIGNVEVTFPIFEKIIKGAVFYDAGNVWRRTDDFLGSTDYKAGAGIGIRVKTPIGPVKVDYGYPLNKNQGDKQEGQFYFSMTRGF